MRIIDGWLLLVVGSIAISASPARAASQYTLAGGVAETANITVDDDLDVYLNNSIIYSDGISGAADRAPISFLANPGDTLRFVVRDTYGTCTNLSNIYLFNTTHQAVLADAGLARLCGRPPTDQGVSHDVSFVIPEPFAAVPGEIIVAAGSGHVVRVDPLTGKRALINDFSNALQGPTGFAGSLTVDTDGTMYVTDQATDEVGKLFKVLPDGTRTLHSDATDATQGLPWHTPFGLGIDSDGSILVTDRGYGGGGNSAGLWSVDAMTGARTRITDSGSVNGGHSSPESVLVDANGDLLIGDAEGPLWTGTGIYCYELGDCGALFQVSRANGALTVLSDFDTLVQGPRGEDAGHSMALDSDGGIFMVDAYYAGTGGLFRVSLPGPPPGARVIVTTGLAHTSTVAVLGDGSVVLGNCTVPVGAGFESGLCRVDRVTGAQTLFSDFGDASQGPTGIATSIAFYRPKNFIFSNGFEPPP